MEYQEMLIGSVCTNAYLLNILTQQYSDIKYYNSVYGLLFNSGHAVN